MTNAELNAIRYDRQIDHHYKGYDFWYEDDAWRVVRSDDEREKPYTQVLAVGNGYNSAADVRKYLDATG